jgi:hypothetical protein
MRIGFTSLYSWRPHVEHLHYLAQLARQAGHEALYLTCDADLPTCYTKELRPERSAWMHCARCRIGGVRSYATENVASIGELAGDVQVRSLHASDWSRSSASTLGRFESDADFAGADFASLAERLDAPTRKAHAAALRWIEREQLDAICLFNGRMDATRGVLEAARSAGIPFVSLERTWFGDGLQLLPQENCLGLQSVDRMMSMWQGVALTRAQALRAASHVASRFLRRNGKEWRAYNLAARASDWPAPSTERRVLLVPGSRNEVWSHPDWQLQWPQPTAAYDALLDHLALPPANVVLRCHPNWGERIGSQDGSRSERYYTDWARSRGVHVIASRDATSTLGLIEQTDAIVVNSGSAALEAGMLGKQVIAIAPSIYQQAGFQTRAYTPGDLQALVLHCSLDESHRAAHAAQIARQTLRFCHTMVYRIAQYVPQVRCVTTTRYEYRDGADPQRFIDLLRSGVLQADDAAAASDSTAEDEVLELIAARDWEKLLDASPVATQPALHPVRRRWMFRPVDRLREALPRGDL